MDLLNILGTLSFIFTIAFTYWAYHSEHSVGQSPKSAIIETWVNILVGFSINFVANMLILPLISAHFSDTQNFAMGWIYTAISVIRQYIIRRWFNAKIHKLAIKLTEVDHVK